MAETISWGSRWVNDRYLTWLAPLTLLERIEGREHRFAELFRQLVHCSVALDLVTYCLWTRAATVDQLSHGVRVINEVCGEVGVGQSVAVGGDQGLKVHGHLIGVLSGHARRAAALVVAPWPASLGRGECER